MERDDEMPCGRCDVGVYDHAAAYNKKADAIHKGAQLPECKSFPRTCVGAIHCKQYRAAASMAQEKES